MERSSWGVREEANIERRTAGVTGIRLEESGGECWIGVVWIGLAVRVDVVDVEEDILQVSM